MKRSTHHLLAALLAVIFGLFVGIGTLCGDEFFRGLWEAPETSQDPWTDYGALHPNHLIEYGWDGYASLGQFLNIADNHGIKAVLKIQGPGSGSYMYSKMHSYALSQYELYEAEWDYDQALDHLEGYYHFLHSDTTTDSIGHSIGIPGGGVAWYCDKEDDDTSGIMLKGPCETATGLGAYLLWWNQSLWWADNPDSTGDSLQFRTIVRAMADTSQLIGLNTPVCSLKVYAGYYTNLKVDTVFRKSSFATGQWKNLEVDYTLHEGDNVVTYRMWWSGNCDFWVDRIEAMDMQRGYYMFYSDSLQNHTLYTEILPLLQNVESNYDTTILVGYMMSDEPRRCAFRAHKPINDMVAAELNLPTTTPMNYDFDYRRPEVFTTLANPHEMHIDKYTLRADNKYGVPGSQNNLDTLAYYIEEAYQIAQDNNLPLHTTMQACGTYDPDSNSWGYRNPTGAEIRAESFMALAHGAEKLSFYCYTTFKQSNGDSLYGLVDPNYDHSGALYAAKWQAVQEVFTQLDAIGDTLLDLVRDTAFCVYPNNSGFKLPISNVYFTDDPQSQNYIEIGQFHRPPSNSPDYLILVNRRTNGDRHITVETNKSGSWALRDLYTQEKFISYGGDFGWIPFDSGEGRVFALQPEISLDKSAMAH